RGLQPALLASAILLLATALPALAGKGNAGNPGILPPQSHAYGKTYVEWSVKWWQWVFSLPATNSPILDTGDCSAGQSGHVWCLDDPMTSPYRVGPQVFSYTLASTDNIIANHFGLACIPNGTTVAGAAEDGVYLLLAPLSAGQHTIRFTAHFSGGGSLDITY